VSPVGVNSLLKLCHRHPCGFVLTKLYARKHSTNEQVTSIELMVFLLLNSSCAACCVPYILVIIQSSMLWVLILLTLFC
jgi:hypothetical protein